jgi:hypothetical protein
MELAKTEFPERATPDNPDGYLVVQRNLEFLRDKFDPLNASFADKFDQNPGTPVTGSRGGNVALQNLLTVLVSLGIITDSTSP